MRRCRRQRSGALPPACYVAPRYGIVGEWGAGTVRLTNGTEATFMFGRAAANFQVLYRLGL